MVSFQEDASIGFIGEPRASATGGNAEPGTGIAECYGRMPRKAIANLGDSAFLQPPTARSETMANRFQGGSVGEPCSVLFTIEGK